MASKFRFGLMTPVEHHPDDDIQTRFANVMELAKLADEAGFDYLDAPQHYLSASSQYLHCIPVLARLAAETRNV